MTDINTIKNLRNNHDKSINDIAQSLNINWRTAKKYADHPVLPQPTKQLKRGMMYDEKWGDIVSLWLEEDFRLPKKKRRTALNYFEALCDLNFSGSYRTVTNYVREWKSNHHQVLPAAGYERLEHPPGEAQLDFGTMEVEHQGVFKDVKALVLSFPFSNAGFAVALPSENQECLLTGMTQLFDQIGGVPRKIRIDNMVTAVVQPKSKFKPAVLSEGFQLFSLHYGFETRFWRVGDLVLALEKAWQSNQLEQFKKQFSQVKLIILDEMVYVPFTKNGSELLFQLISDWYEQRSLIFTSNLEFSSWNKVFIDPA